MLIFPNKLFPQALHQDRHGDVSPNEFAAFMGVQVPLIASALSRRSATVAAAHGYQHVRFGAATTAAATRLDAIDGFQRKLAPGNALQSTPRFGASTRLQHVRSVGPGETFLKRRKTTI